MSNKYCKKCGETKPIEEFSVRNASKDGHYTYCKACASIKDKAYYNKNRDKIKAAVKEYRKKNRVKLNNQRHKKVHSHPNFVFMSEYKRECGCYHCGETDPLILQYHHKDPSTKLFNIGDSICISKTQDELIEEISKCIVLCANCHIIEHRSKL